MVSSESAANGRAPAAWPALVANDPAHAPFGATWLRGFTPLRIAFFFAVALSFSLERAIVPVLAGNYELASYRVYNAWWRTVVAALPMFVFVIKTQSWTISASHRRQVVAMALAVVLGAVAYAAVRTGVRFALWPRDMVMDTAAFWYLQGAYFSWSLVVGSVMAAILHFAERERAVARRLHRTRLEKVEVERQLIEARLSLLQAQIAPHFLFNSLASAKRLYEKDGAQGRQFVRNLTDYLRTATASARVREIALAEEVLLARRFLGIFQVRMGHRLRTEIDVPEHLGAARVPPLTIGTLVENAIKHGISPRASGGTVSILARREGGVLVVEVRDDGVGFRTQSGSGVGLANIRARVETLYGTGGSLDLSSNAAGGITATLRLPCPMAIAA